VPADRIADAILREAGRHGAADRRDVRGG
jgi:hypothetical protein